MYKVFFAMLLAAMPAVAMDMYEGDAVTTDEYAETMDNADDAQAEAEAADDAAMDEGEVEVESDHDHSAH